MRERQRMERELETLGFQHDTTTVKKNVVLVAGFDSNFSGINFDKLCRNRIEMYLKDAAIYKDKDFVFTLFDVSSGKGKLNHLPDGKTKREWKEDPTKSFKTVNRENYKDLQFRKKPEGVMSITDVYAHIQTLDPGSVREFTFFGHGWIEGPVLVNSSEADNFKGDTRRDPNDKDGRGHKDFLPPNMSDAERKKLSEAFHKDGFVWIWGCVFEEHYRQVLHKVINNPIYRKAPGNVKDTDNFLFHFNPAMANQFFKEDSQFFPPEENGKHKLKFMRTFKQVKEFFQRGIDRSYCSHAAKALGRVCYGALPGTYSDIEKGVALPLMLVPRNFARYGANLWSYVQFYKLHFGVSEDPLSKGYGAFTP